MSLFDQVKLLHASELYKDLHTLAGLSLTLADNNPELFTLPQKYQCLVFYADALYESVEYGRAEIAYRKALQLKKSLNKTKGKVPSTELTSEVDIKYKIHLCHCKLKQFTEAMNMLESISAKQRSAKINLALAHLYSRTGMDRSAIMCFKEVLRECPLAVDAIQGLLALGVKGAEVIALVMNGIPQGLNIEWLTSWIKGHACLSVHEHGNAISTFKNLDVKSCLQDNIDVLANLGRAYFIKGDYTNAGLILKRTHLLDPLSLRHMDLYSNVLAREEKVKELESLSAHLMAITDRSPEPWIATGYLCLVTKRATRSVYFAQRAITLDACSVEGLLLKASSLLEMKKTPNAGLHFREALRLAPNRYEAHCGLIECYTATHRIREAISLASKAVKILGSSARSLTLLASVLMKEPTMILKAKQYLEKAMKTDITYLEPVYLMAEVLAQEHQFEKGIELLRHQLQNQSTCRLHQMLADFLFETNQHLDALEQYNIALHCDPSNIRAREGMERVEKQTEAGMDGSYEVEEEIGNSDNEADFEGSDVESGWSETEFT